MTQHTTDPRAGKLCTSCNGRRPETPEPHCYKNPRCPWWKCPRCGAANDAAGRNSATLRDGTPRKEAG